VSVNEGRTVLFVSHNMGSVRSLCPESICLLDGEIIQRGSSTEVIEFYQSSGVGRVSNLEWGENTRPGDDVAQLVSVKLLNSREEPVAGFEFYEGGLVEIIYEVKTASVLAIPNLRIYREGVEILTTHELVEKVSKDKGVYRSLLAIPAHFLNVGVYTVGIAVTSFPPFRHCFHINPSLVFDVVEKDYSLRNYPSPREFPALLRPLLEWKTERLDLN